MIRKPETAGGNPLTLLACFLHFDISFTLWVLLGALGIYIAEAAGMDAAQKGLMVAIPILTGSLLRVPLGLLSDRIGGRRVGIGILVVLMAPLALGWQGGHDISTLYLLGTMLGVAGASFAVVLPMASRWYPAERQGLVMGIAAAGNSGTVMANVFAPRIAAVVGWHNVFGLAMLPLMAVLLLFAVLAKDAPAAATRPPIADYLTLMKQSDIWWFCLFYCVTFGGYVGLSSFLPLFLRDHYGVSPVTAGSLTALTALVGSAVRPIGGYVADRIGGVRLLLFLLLGIGLAYAAAARLPALVVMETLLVFGMVCLGMGNGAVFQLVPQRFQSQIGMATGVVGAVGGLGGFLLPMLLGTLKQSTGSFGPGFLVLALLAMGAALKLQRLLAVQMSWRRGFVTAVEEPAS